MKHDFGNIVIPEGESEVTVSCIHCGAKLVKYTNGHRAYITPTGKRTCRATACRSAVVVPISRPRPHTDAEARLVEAMVMIRLMHDELKAAGMDTKGRQMAGRFLESREYKNLATGLAM